MHVIWVVLPDDFGKKVHRQQKVTAFLKGEKYTSGR